MNVNCDKCNKNFDISKDSIDTVVIDNIECNYFKCTECKTKYIIDCKNDYIRKEQRRLARIKKQIENAKDDIDKAMIRVKYQSCLNNMVIHSNRLRMEMQNKI